MTIPRYEARHAAGISDSPVWQSWTHCRGTPQCFGGAQARREECFE